MSVSKRLRNYDDNKVLSEELARRVRDEKDVVYDDEGNAIASVPSLYHSHEALRRLRYKAHENPSCL